MSRRHARGWLLALSLTGLFSSLLESQTPRATPNAKRPASPKLTCIVAKLADGDSFTCADGRKVRLLLIDTPEMAQAPWGLMAKRQLEALMRPGTTVRLELDRTAVDRYRRTLAYVWADSVLVNEVMVAKGWAVVLAYENVRHLERLQRAERAAQAAKRGFWQAWAFRCRPVDFRAKRCGSPRR
ncbi:MAG: thermonuclease family protein [Gemmatimonadaceae bacterium]|nr:thermonuclease family protein [Gemmatimonadaceae bacterium]